MGLIHHSLSLSLWLSEMSVQSEPMYYKAGIFHFCRLHKDNPQGDLISYSIHRADDGGSGIQKLGCNTEAEMWDLQTMFI